MVYKDLFKTVNLGAITDEPTLIQMVFDYYNKTFDADLSMKYTVEYFQKLKDTTNGI